MARYSEVKIFRLKTDAPRCDPFISTQSKNCGWPIRNQRIRWHTCGQMPSAAHTCTHIS